MFTSSLGPFSAFIVFHLINYSLFGYLVLAVCWVMTNLLQNPKDEYEELQQKLGRISVLK